MKILTKVVCLGSLWILTACNNESRMLNDSIIGQASQQGSYTLSNTNRTGEDGIEFNPVLTATLFEKIVLGHTDSVNSLLSKGANPNGVNDEGTPALLYAVQHNKISIVKLLLTHKADPNAADIHGITPLMQVVRNENKSIPKVLSDGTVIYLEPESKFNKYLAELFLSYGANIDALNENHETALLLAANCNNVDAVNYLLEKGADPNQRNTNMLSSLMIASLNGNIDVVKSLIQGKADIAATDSDGQTVLIMAVQSGNPEMVKFLISKGALLDAQDVFGASPLKVAKALGNKEIIGILSEKLKHQ